MQQKPEERNHPTIEAEDDISSEVQERVEKILETPKSEEKKVSTERIEEQIKVEEAAR